MIGRPALRPGRPRLLAVLALTLALSAGACLGDPGASASPTPSREPGPTPVITRYDLGTRVWYAGLILTLVDVTAELDPRGGPVSVSVRLENPGAEPIELNGPITLAVGEAIFQPTVDSHVPPIGPGSVAGAVLTFDVDVASVADGIVRIGEAPKHVATVPLRQETGAPVTFEPIQLSVGNTVRAADLQVRLRSGELRWDLPDWAEEMDATHQALTLTYDATYVGTFSGGFAFTAENVSLRLPDRKVVEPRRDGHSQSVALIAAGKTASKLISRFEVPTGMTGQFALLVKSGSTTRAISFTIGG